MNEEQQQMMSVRYIRSKEEELSVQAHKLYLEAENVHMYALDIAHGGDGSYIHSNTSSFDAFPNAVEKLEKQLEIVKAHWKMVDKCKK